MNNTDRHEEIAIILKQIKNSQRDIDLKLDHLIRTYHDKFFEVDDSNVDENPLD